MAIQHSSQDRWVPIELGLTFISDYL